MRLRGIVIQSVSSSAKEFVGDFIVIYSVFAFVVDVIGRSRHYCHHRTRLAFPILVTKSWRNSVKGLVIGGWTFQTDSVSADVNGRNKNPEISNNWPVSRSSLGSRLVSASKDMSEVQGLVRNVFRGFLFVCVYRQFFQLEWVPRPHTIGGGGLATNRLHMPM